MQVIFSILERNWCVVRWHQYHNAKWHSHQKAFYHHDWSPSSWVEVMWPNNASCDTSSLSQTSDRSRSMGDAGRVVKGGLLKAIGVFFEYDTPKIVHIRSKKVGIINRLIQLAILGYIIGWVTMHGSQTQWVVSLRPSGHVLMLIIGKNVHFMHYGRLFCVIMMKREGKFACIMVLWMVNYCISLITKPLFPAPSLCSYAIVYQKGYQEFEAVESAATIKVKGVVYPDFKELNVSIPGITDRIWDAADYVVPPQVGLPFFKLALSLKWSNSGVCGTWMKWGVFLHMSCGRYITFIALVPHMLELSHRSSNSNAPFDYYLIWSWCNLFQENDAFFVTTNAIFTRQSQGTCSEVNSLFIWKSLVGKWGHMVVCCGL